MVLVFENALYALFAVDGAVTIFAQLNEPLCLEVNG